MGKREIGRETHVFQSFCDNTVRDVLHVPYFKKKIIGRETYVFQSSCDNTVRDVLRVPPACISCPPPGSGMDGGREGGRESRDGEWGGREVGKNGERDHRSASSAIFILYVCVYVCTHTHIHTHTHTHTRCYMPKLPSAGTGKIYI